MNYLPLRKFHKGWCEYINNSCVEIKAMDERFSNECEEIFIGLNQTEQLRNSANDSKDCIKLMSVINQKFIDLIDAIKQSQYAPDIRNRYKSTIRSHRTKFFSDCARNLYFLTFHTFMHFFDPTLYTYLRYDYSATNCKQMFRELLVLYRGKCFLVY